MHAYTRFMPSSERGPRRARAAPCLVPPLAAFSLAITFLSPSFHSPAPGFAFLCGFLYAICYAGFLLTPQPSCVAVALFFPSFCPTPFYLSYFLETFICLSCLCCSSTQPSFTLPLPQSSLSGPRGLSDCKEGWKGEISDFV